MSLHTIEFAIANGLPFKVSTYFDFVSVVEFKDDTVVIKCKLPTDNFCDEVEFYRDMLVEVVWVEDAAALTSIKKSLASEYNMIVAMLQSRCSIASVKRVHDLTSRLDKLEQQIADIDTKLYG